MPSKRRLLSATAIVGLAFGFWSQADRRSDVQAAKVDASLTAPAPMATHAHQEPANEVSTGPSPTLLRQYCVGCHNDRMKGNYGNLSLENVDVGNAAAHVETLEKVVPKLRKCQMPPEGRPRPEPAAL